MATRIAFVWTHYPATLSGVQRFRKPYNMPETTFGRLAVNDPNLVKQLRAGARIGERRQARIEEFMKEYQRND